jgi:hypothetical protein
MMIGSPRLHPLFNPVMVGLAGVLAFILAVPAGATVGSLLKKVQRKKNNP